MPISKHAPAALVLIALSSCGPGVAADGPVEQRLRAVLERPASGRRVAVFDCDNTLIQHDIGYASFFRLAAGRQLTRDPQLLARLLPPALAARVAAGEPPGLPELHGHYLERCRAHGEAACFAWLIRLFAGFTPAELDRFAGEVVGQELARPPCSFTLSGERHGRGVRPYPAQRALIERLTARGFEVWVVTASPERVVQKLAPHLGVPASRVIGNRLRLEGGRYTDTVLPPLTTGAGKVEAIRQRIGVRPLLAVGDSASDTEMLDAAELGVLVDRDDPALRRRARAHGWALQPRLAEPAPACAPSGTR